MLQEARLYNEDITSWSFLSKLKYTHENWKHPDKIDLNRPFRPYIVHGNVYLLDTLTDPYENIYDASDPDAEAPVTESAERYLSEMAALCDEAGVELVLLTEKLRFTKAEHNTMARLAEQYGLKYIDVNEHVEEIGFVHHRDLYDPTHFNLSGAVKFTDWLGKYLSENYEFTDKRTLPGYDRYHDHSAEFNRKKEYVQGIPFYEYLEELAALDKRESIIFVSIFDEASEKLSDRGAELLKALGLNTELRKKYRWSYAAVIHASGVREEHAPDSEGPVMLGGAIEGVPYVAASGGYSNMEEARVVVNGTDYMQKGRGFNFVVYNIPSGQVTESMFFDTNARENPHRETKTEEYERLAEEGTFRSRLMELAKLDTREHAIFLSVSDEATVGLRDIDMALLEALGLKTDLRGQYRCSYAAALYDSRVREDFSPGGLATLTGTAGGLSYEVVSGGYPTMDEAHILLDGMDYMRRGRKEKARRARCSACMSPGTILW